MFKDALFEQLRQVERDVAEGEQRLAEQEALLRSLKQSDGDFKKAQAVLDMMWENQRQREQDRQRLLSLLHP